MPLESFYGGKQGVSPIIKARFQYVTNALDSNNEYIDKAYGRAISKANGNQNSINNINMETMEYCFSQSDYTDVWFGELAIINTKNKRNENNGKLFRRVLKKENAQDGVAHAEYIGTIVGPSEGFPFIDIAGSIEGDTGLKKTVANIPTDLGDFEFSYPTGEKQRIVSYEFNNNTDIHTYEANVENNALVPGAVKTGEDWTYEKGIKYSWVNVRNNIDGEEQDTYVYLGFEVPYTIFDFNFDTKPWNYTGKIAEFTNEDNYLGIKPITATANQNWQSTPFYQNWQIHLLKGKPGNQIGYLRRVKANSFRNFDLTNTNKPFLFPYNQIFNIYNSTATENFDITVPNVTSQGRIAGTQTYVNTSAFFGEPENTLNGNSDILVYTIYSINNDNSIKQVDCYLCRTRDVNNITLGSDGTVTIAYSDNTTSELEQKIKWISNIQSTTLTNGNNSIKGFQVNYNTGDSTQLFVPYLHDVALATDLDNEGNPIYSVRYRMAGTNGANIGLEETLKTKDNIDFNFSILKSLKIDGDTRELVYSTLPSQHKMSLDDTSWNDWDSVNNGDDYWTRFGENGVYLNEVDKVIIYNGYLYVLYSSSKYRYQFSENDTMISEYISELNTTYPSDIVFENITGKKWRRSSAPDFKPNNLPMDESEWNNTEWTKFWWLELGQVEKPKSGVWVSSEFDTERFVTYFKAKYSQYPALANITWDSFTFSNEALAVASLMNGEWPQNTPIDGVVYETPIDGGWTIIADDSNLDTNPYKDGHIYLYERNARNDNNRVNLYLLPNNDQAGNLVKHNNYYYYYDYAVNRWKIAGVFGSAGSGGGEGKSSIVLKAISPQGNTTVNVPDVELNDLDQALLLLEEKIILSDNLPFSLPSISDIFKEK